VLTRQRAAHGDADAKSDRRAVPLHSPEDRLGESKGLAEAIDLDVVEARRCGLARLGVVFGGLAGACGQRLSPIACSVRSVASSPSTITRRRAAG